MNKPIFSCGDAPDFELKDFCIPQFDLSGGECKADANYQQEIMEQAMMIASANINLFPLLGISNQGSTIDPFEHGYPISNSTSPDSNIYNAFNIDDEIWESSLKGEDLLSSYIGYCLGTKKNKANGERYSTPSPIIMNVNSIYIEQINNHEVKQFRIDSSMDGIHWEKVDTITYKPNQFFYPIRQSPKANQFRIVPLMVLHNNSWKIKKIEFIEDTSLSLDTIQDHFFNENRDREYSRVSICLKGLYDQVDSATELSMLGVELPERFVIKFSLNYIVSLLARPIVVGDILELPSEIQYDANLKPVRKWLEVMDVSWDVESTTIDWKKHIIKVTAGPLTVSQENAHLLGNNQTVIDNIDTQDFVERYINVNPFISSDEINREAEDKVPLTGTDTMDILTSTIDQDGNLISVSHSDKQLYISDAMPPNNEPYDEGDQLPNTSLDGHYFRLIQKTENNIKLPVRLYRFNAIKNQWIHVETSGRKKYISHKPIANILLTSDGSKNIDDK